MSILFVGGGDGSGGGGSSRIDSIQEGYWNHYQLWNNSWLPKGAYFSWPLPSNKAEVWERRNMLMLEEEDHHYYLCCRCSGSGWSSFGHPFSIRDWLVMFHDPTQIAKTIDVLVDWNFVTLSKTFLSHRHLLYNFHNECVSKKWGGEPKHKSTTEKELDQ